MIYESELLELIDERDIVEYLEDNGYTVTMGVQEDESIKVLPCLPEFWTLNRAQVRDVLTDALGLQRTASDEHIINKLKLYLQ